MAEKQSDTVTAKREENRTRSDTQLARGGAASLFMNPFALLGRLAEEMTSVFSEAGSSRASRSQPSGASPVVAWAPDIDVFQRGSELVVRADIPGVNPDDIVVEISDDAITVSGERSEEREEERNGVYRVERSYGSFYRVIPLREGAIADQAKASVKNGVLEITIPAPPEQVSRGRRLEITRGEERADQRESSNARKSTST